MKVIVSDLKDTGARWIFFGESVHVDENFLEEFIKKHPETKLMD